jgi:hypothetical protein
MVGGVRTGIRRVIRDPPLQTGQTAGTAGTAFSLATRAKKAELAFGIRRCVAKSTYTIPNRFWYP